MSSLEEQLKLHGQIMKSCVYAMVEMEAMKAKNKQRELQGLSLAYDDNAFFSLICEHSLGENS